MFSNRMFTQLCLSFQSNEIFAWSDGWNPLNYINWGHENNAKNTFCTQMNVTNDGKWDAVDCGTTLPYMCKFSTSKHEQ